MFGQLWRNDDQGCTQILQARDDPLESVQLRVAVRSPLATEKIQDQCAIHHQAFRFDQLRPSVAKGKVRNRVADPDNAVHDARRPQVLGGAVHDCSFVRWNAGLGTVTNLVELFFESHHESPCADDTSRNCAKYCSPIEFKPSPPFFVSRTPTTQEPEVVPTTTAKKARPEAGPVTHQI